MTIILYILAFIGLMTVILFGVFTYIAFASARSITRMHQSELDRMEAGVNDLYRNPTFYKRNDL